MKKYAKACLPKILNEAMTDREGELGKIKQGRFCGPQRKALKLNAHCLFLFFLGSCLYFISYEFDSLI